MKWAGHVARVGEMKGLCMVLVGKPEGNRPPVRPRRRGGIRLRCIFGKWGMDWIELAQDEDRWRALLIPVMNLLAL
jgi:hypothetical protein